MQTATTFQVLANLLVYVLLLCIMWHRTTSLSQSRGGTSRLSDVTVWSLILVACLFPFYSGDYFHYISHIRKIEAGIDVNLESVYYYIAEKVHYNYLYWRLTVWGGAIALLYWLLSRLPQHEDILLFCFIAVYLLEFSYSRVNLSQIVMFSGCVFYVQSRVKREFLYSVLGLAIILVSLFFHKSALYGIFVMLLAIATVRFFSIKLLVVMIAVFMMFLNQMTSLLSDMIYSVVYEDSELINVDVAHIYVETKYVSAGLGEMLQNALTRSVQYVYVCFFMVVLLNGIYRKMPYYIQVLMLQAFFSIVFALAFLLDFNINTYVFYFRFLKFSYMSIVIVIAYMIQQRLFVRWAKTMLYLGMSGSLYTLLYSAYCAYSHQM